MFTYKTTIAQQIFSEYSFINYSVNQGLPSSEAYDLYQDKKTGILWIATDRGLVRFDGYKFDTYSMEDGLTDNVILKLTPDFNGNIWCHTLNNKLCYLDTTNRIREFKYNAILRKSMERSGSGDFRIARIFFSKDKKLSVGPNFFSGKIEIDNNGMVKSDIAPIRNGCSGYVNLMEGTPFYCFSDSIHVNHNSYPVTDFQFSSIQAIGRNLFLHTNKSEVSIYWGTQLKRKIKLKESVLFSGKLNDTLFWVSYKNGGVNFFNISGNQKFSFFEKEVITDVLQDNEGGIWFSSISNGLYYLKNLLIKAYYSSGNTRISSISGNRDNLIIGYFNGNVAFLNVKKGKLELRNDFGSKSPVQVQAGANNNVYVGSAKGEFSGVLDKYLKIKTRINCGITKISDSPNALEYFFCSYDRFVFSNENSNKTYLTNYRPRDMARMGNRILLARSDGLFEFNEGTCKKINEKKLNYRIDDMDTFRNGIVCASLGGGVIFYNRDTLFSLKKSDGLLSDLSTEVFVENDSVVWLATSSGVNKIVINRANNYKIYTYTNTEGLISNEVTDIDMTDNYIWIATKKGLNFIDKKEKSGQSKTAPFLNMDKISVNGLIIQNLSASLNLKFDQNNLEVFYTAVSYSRNKELIYRYKLEVSDPTWHLTANRSIVFSSLPPGQHNFIIQASTDNVNWSNEKRININIEVPFWQTNWFALVLFFGFVFTLLLIFGYLIRQQTLKAKASDMELKALRSQMNSHFIFNSLASIQNFILKGNVADSNKYLVKFSKLIRGVLENSKEEFISLKREIETLGLYIELEKLRVKEFEYVLTIEPGIDLEKTKIPPLLFQPFVENAIWHGFEPLSGKGILKLEITIHEGKLLCIIEDNGVGIDYREKTRSSSGKLKSATRSFGTQITLERIAALNNERTSDITIKIIDKREINTELTGTKIEIVLPKRMLE